MLRLFVLLLLIANGAYFAWANGHLSGLGLFPHTPGEAQRLNAQIRPKALSLLNVGEPTAATLTTASTASSTSSIAAAASSTVSAPAECLQTALLDNKQLVAVNDLAAKLPQGSWRLEETSASARWIVYMGKYTDPAMLAKKKSELRALSIAFESVRAANLQPGISLGAFDSESLANDERAQLTKRGIRTARVVQESPERTGQRLVLPKADDALKSQLDGLKQALGANALQACQS